VPAGAPAGGARAPSVFSSIPNQSSKESIVQFAALLMATNFKEQPSRNQK